MMWNGPMVSGGHKAQLALELIHAAVVLTVVGCVTALALFAPAVVPNDVIGTVYGGALGYAAGRAGGTLGRDTPTIREHDRVVP